MPRRVVRLALFACVAFVLCVSCGGMPPRTAEPGAPAVLPAVAAASPPVATSAGGSGSKTEAHENEPECFSWYVDDEARETAACRALKKRNLEALASVRPVVDWGAGGFDPERAANVCFPHADGTAWGVVLSQPKESGEPGSGNERLEARLSLAHVDAEGSILVSKKSWTYTAAPYERTIFGSPNNSPAVYDFDGDGAAEIVFLIGTSAHSGSGELHGSVWTFKDGKVEPYPGVAFDIIDARDVDCDGRPDLGFIGPFEATVHCTSRSHSSVNGPRFAAHALPDGTFSTTDDIAVNVAQYECDAPPKSLHFDGDEGDLLLEVRCARLWGVPSAELERQIQQICKAPRPREDCINKRPGVCVLYETLLDWARAEPPLTLR